MRIVGISSFMNAAGAQIALVRLMSQLRLRGHDTQTWFFYDVNPAFRGMPHIHSFYAKPKLSALEYASLPRKLIKRLSDAKPDAVVTFLPLACILGQTAALACGVPRRVASQRTPASTVNPIMRLADAALGTMGVYTDNVCVSQAVCDEFVNYPDAYRRKLSVVHNGIDWKASALSRKQARAQFGFADGEVVAVATGRLKQQKNVALLLDAMAHAPNVKLVIGGDGPLRGELEAQRAALGLQDRVTFLGTLTQSGVANLLCAGDIFVQTSLFEGQSNSILEAMNAGLAIVASDIDTQRETLIADGVSSAILLPLGDAPLWGATLAELSQAPERRAALGASARALVERRFSLGAMIDGFEKVLAVDPQEPALKLAMGA